MDHKITDTQLACIQLAAQEIHWGSFEAGLAAGLSSEVTPEGLRRSTWVAADDEQMRKASRALTHLHDVLTRVRLGQPGGPE